MYVTFQKFSDRGAAIELAELLKSHKLDPVLEDASAAFDPSFAFSEIVKEYRIKLRREDFEKAESLLLQLSEKEVENLDKGHYLFGFTDEELIEVVSKPDEWNRVDYVLAKKLLKERGITIDPKDADNLKKKRLSELSKPYEGQTGWIIFGYILAFLGGLLGIFIGWHLCYHKRTLPNGERVYAYIKADRGHGNSILIIGVFCFIIGVISAFWKLIRF